MLESSKYTQAHSLDEYLLILALTGPRTIYLYEHKCFTDSRERAMRPLGLWLPISVADTASLEGYTSCDQFRWPNLVVGITSLGKQYLNEKYSDLHGTLIAMSI